MLGQKSMVKQVKQNDKMPELLTLSEACGILKCHPNTLRQWDKKAFWLRFVLARVKTGVIASQI